jgi:hypothetical protein
MPKTLAERGFRRVAVSGHYRYQQGGRFVSASVVDAERAKIAKAAARETARLQREAEVARIERAAKRAEKLRAAARLKKPPQIAPKPGHRPAKKTDVEKVLRDAGLSEWRVVPKEPRTRAVRRERAEAAAAQAEADRLAVEQGNLREAQAEARRLRDLDARAVASAKSAGFHAVPAPAITAQDLLAPVQARGAFVQYRYRAGAVVNGRKVGGQIAKVSHFAALSPKRQAMLRKEVFARTQKGSLGSRTAALEHRLMIAMRRGETWLQLGADYLQAALRLSLL